jgi:hypothetical protein
LSQFEEKAGGRSSTGFSLRLPARLSGSAASEAKHGFGWLTKGYGAASDRLGWLFLWGKRGSLKRLFWP